MITSEIKTLLSGVANVYVGSQPAAPDNVVTVYNSGGFPRQLSGSFIEEPTVQILVRNLSYAAGETVCQTVKDALHGKSTTNIMVIQQMGDIQDMGRDNNGRQEFSLNFRMYYKR